MKLLSFTIKFIILIVIITTLLLYPHIIVYSYNNENNSHDTTGVVSISDELSNLDIQYSSKPHTVDSGGVSLFADKLKTIKFKKIVYAPLPKKIIPIVENVKQQEPVKVQPVSIVPAGDIQTYAKNRVCEVFGCDQWDNFYFIINKESGWNYKAINKSSGAGGLCQSLPFSKMATKGADYQSNPNTQIEWCISYIQSRYTNPSGAYNFWTSHRWF